ncbi:hypothetical protein ACM01_27550 [Streptomyces viridochromogenes]|uniref:Uncharacterized protein n=1 Tax=Streptomyces viridochromogenes TaxID=1938 RepID=A0A0J7Z592_STRVR|nr:hypothetical protein [Streptomyces viridochromogenes]KMS71341.1 hypothetical protein ACM01_27550 [Streptomyces viridochromogenes]KOG16623.1 hypothetical protein ADK36_26805 [Streptomyces viridochromogenes]KOG17329.1 hypothetical protein ADK35_24285 [Streptomyces viridochromogenes]
MTTSPRSPPRRPGAGTFFLVSRHLCQESVTRFVVTGANASFTVSGSTLVVARATKVLPLNKAGRYDPATG